MDYIDFMERYENERKFSCLIDYEGIIHYRFLFIETVTLPGTTKSIRQLPGNIT